MHFKGLLLAAASLAFVCDATVAEREIPSDVLDLVPTEVLQNIPSEVLDQIPTEIMEDIPADVTSIYGALTSVLIPAITALPPSVISELTNVFPTLQPDQYESFISSIVTHFPPEVQSSIIAIQSSALENMTGAPNSPTETGAGNNNGDPTNTDSASGTDTPNSASRSLVGLSMVGIAGVLGLVLAL